MLLIIPPVRFVALSVESQMMFAKVERNVWLIKLAPVDGNAPPSHAPKAHVMLLYETGMKLRGL